ncbi:unnamed protein product, partial [Discosporangium mesarthrocarpum]
DQDEDDDSGRNLLEPPKLEIKGQVRENGDDDDDDENKPGRRRVMMSSVFDAVDEGLGEEYEETPWVPPTVERAMEHRERSIYRGGKSGVRETKIHELEDMGIGVSLYFQFLKFLTFTYLVLMILSLPSLIFATAGSGFPEVNVLSGLLWTMVGNVGYPCEEGATSEQYTAGCNATLSTTQDIYGHVYTLVDISYTITSFEFISSAFFALMIIYWTWRTRAAVDKARGWLHVDANKITATDYAVYVEGLPKNAGRRDIGRFFRQEKRTNVELYQLEKADWKGRPPYETAQSVFSVDNTGDKWYKGKWVAEVCVAREVGREIKAYKDKKDTVMELKRKRAEAKMYNEGTPLLDGNGADPRQFAKSVKAADKLGEKIARTTDKIMEARKDIDAKQARDCLRGKACVGCFIVFNHPLSLHRCMEDFSKLGWKYPRELKFEGRHKLKVSKALEPDNIIWENLEFGKTKRWWRRNCTSFVSAILLVLSFAVVLGMNGVQDTFSQKMPKIEYCETEVPALFFNNYSVVASSVDSISLVRPDQSYRADYDKDCQDTLGDDTSAYIVYTIESGTNSWESPALNYSLSACEPDADICPAAGEALRCPCSSADNNQECDTLSCNLYDDDDGCANFPFNTVSGCYCYGRLLGNQAKGNIISAAKDLRANDSAVCGAFVLAFLFAKVLNVLISFVTPTINTLLEKSLTGLVDWEHNTSDDEAATRLMFGVFQTQYINTGILFLLVYGTAPEGYTTPQILQDVQIYTGPYNDFSRAWQMDAGNQLLISFILAALTPHFWPLLDYFVFSKRKQRKAKKGIEEGDGSYAMQSDLNEVFVGPEFDFTVRYSYLLTLLFVSMTYSGGLFIMNSLSFFFFLITYWIDKMMLLRFYHRPPHREDALQRQVNNTLPYALLIHLCFTCWFLGNDSLKSEVITSSVQQAAAYEGTIANLEAQYGLLVSRLVRTNVFPVFLLTLVIFVWCLLDFIGKFFPLLAFIAKVIRMILGLCFGGVTKRRVIVPGKKIRSKWTSEVAAYTDVYYQYIPKNGDLTTAQKLEGWMVSHLPGGETVKKKGWDLDQEHLTGRDAKFSWEVIADNSVFTYRIDLVPGYAEIIGALKEEERLYKADIEAGSESEEEEEEEDEEEEGEDDEEEDEEARHTGSHNPPPLACSAKKNAYNPFAEFEEGAKDGDMTGGDDNSYNPFDDFMGGV